MATFGLLGRNTLNYSFILSNGLLNLLGMQSNNGTKSFKRFMYLNDEISLHLESRKKEIIIKIII